MVLRRDITRFLLAVFLMAGATLCANAQMVERVEPASNVADSLMALLDGRTLDPIEGIWQWADDGATVAVTRQTDTTFDFVVIDSPNTSLKPGTVIGTAKITAKPGSYDARFMSQTNKFGIPTKPKRAIITVNNRGGMAIDEYDTGYKINFHRLIPYIFHISLVRGKSKPANVDGPVRIYPVDTPMVTTILL